MAKVLGQDHMAIKTGTAGETVTLRGGMVILTSTIPVVVLEVWQGTFKICVAKRQRLVK